MMCLVLEKVRRGEVFRSEFVSKCVAENSPDEESLLTLEAIKESCEDNDRCFDCQAPSPQWCSLNLGVWVCSSCSGHHRYMIFSSAAIEG